jgi:hypothetical protein
MVCVCVREREREGVLEEAVSIQVMSPYAGMQVMSRW